MVYQSLNEKVQMLMHLLLLGPIAATVESAFITMEQISMYSDLYIVKRAWYRV